MYRRWKGVCKGYRQKEATLELELLVRGAIDEIDDDSRSNSCEGFRQPAMMLCNNTQGNALLLLHRLLRPFSSHSGAGCPTDLEVKLHDIRYPKLELESRREKSPLSSQGILNTAREVQSPATPPTTSNTSTNSIVIDTADIVSLWDCKVGGPAAWVNADKRN